MLTVHARTEGFEPSTSRFASRVLGPMSYVRMMEIWWDARNIRHQLHWSLQGAR